MVVYGAYIQGNCGDAASALMVKNNAAPTLMDSWSVLRKRHARALLALNQAELARRVRLISAHSALQGKKIILIGEPNRGSSA